MLFIHSAYDNKVQLKRHRAAVHEPPKKESYLRYFSYRNAKYFFDPMKLKLSSILCIGCFPL